MKKSKDYLRIEETADITNAIKAKIDPVMAEARKEYGKDLLGFLVGIVVELEPGYSISRFMITAPKHIARQALEQMLKDLDKEEGWSHEE